MPNLSFQPFSIPIALRSARGVREPPERGFGLAIATGHDEFIVADANLQVSFGTNPRSDEVVGLTTVEGLHPHFPPLQSLGRANEVTG